MEVTPRALRERNENTLREMPRRCGGMSRISGYGTARLKWRRRFRQHYAF